MQTDGQKVSKRSVNYRKADGHSRTAEGVMKRCGNCCMYHPKQVPMNRCDEVIGPIYPEDVCNDWCKDS
jgi:hypothetical protein